MDSRVLAVAAACAMLGGCGDEAPEPAAPTADEQRTLSEAAEMLPPAATEPTTDAAPVPQAAVEAGAASGFKVISPSPE